MARKKSRGLVVIERGGSGSGLLWLLVGGAVGAGLGLLFAPHSGKKTRELLGERLTSLKETAEDALHQLREDDEDEDAPDETDEPEAEAADAGETAEVEEESEAPVTVRAGRDGPSARAELEQRLARARARRHRALAEEDEEPVA
jgi:hypothetical protein